MSYNPEIHRRRSIRLEGYDYSHAGMYFITICVQNKEHLFGQVIDGKMKVNYAGLMIEKWYRELEIKYPDIACHEMVVMPNHFHALIEIVDKTGVDVNSVENCSEEKIRATKDIKVFGEHKNSPLYRVLQWFKTMSTNEYIRAVKNKGWKRFDGKLWQRNYWEHIIRDQDDHDRIVNYILDNPQNWGIDKLNRNERID